MRKVTILINGKPFKFETYPPHITEAFILWGCRQLGSPEIKDLEQWYLYLEKFQGFMVHFNGTPPWEVPEDQKQAYFRSGSRLDQFSIIWAMQLYFDFRKDRNYLASPLVDVAIRPMTLKPKKRKVGIVTRYTIPGPPSPAQNLINQILEDDKIPAEHRRIAYLETRVRDLIWPDVIEQAKELVQRQIDTEEKRAAQLARARAAARISVGTPLNPCPTPYAQVIFSDVRGDTAAEKARAEQVANQAIQIMVLNRRYPVV